MVAGLGVGVGSALMKRRDQLLRLVRGGGAEPHAHDVDSVSPRYEQRPDSEEEAWGPPVPVTSAAMDVGEEVDPVATASTSGAGSGEGESGPGEAGSSAGDEPGASDPDAGSSEAETSASDRTQGRSTDR